MRRLLVALALMIPGAALAAPPANFDKRVETVRRDLDAAGFAVTIVENGKVTFAKGYGEKLLGSGQRVDADSLFQIGSVTKHFTAAALATRIQ